MNIAEILKDCPEGTKLYSPAYGEVNFIRVTSPITIKIKLSKLSNNEIKYFFGNGNINIVDGECMLFPSKEQRDWDKFRLPVKRGDIMMNIEGECPFIATGEMDGNAPKYICGINSLGEFQSDLFGRGWTSNFYIPASEKAKKELFDKMEEAGYKWNADTLELEKATSKVESKFKPFDKVLVRDDLNEEWSINLFSYYDREDQDYPYVCISGRYGYCIPYEGNEYFVGKTDNIKKI